MIYNPDRNYLFVHIQKTAGTSITETLLGLPGSRFVAPPHLRLRDIVIDPHHRPFVFAVVRNPFERLVSWYRMMLRKGFHNDFSRYLLGDDGDTAHAGFSRFIRRTAAVVETADYGTPFVPAPGDVIRLRRPGVYAKSIAFNQIDYLTDRRNALACDAVLRFEHLDREWPALLSRLHPEVTAGDLPRRNVDPQPPTDWRRFFADGDDRSWVEHLYARDIATVSYEWR